MLLLIHLFCILRRSTWKWAVRPQTRSAFIMFLLSSNMCIVSNLTPQTFECEWDVKWCGKEQQSRQNDLKSGLNAQLPLAHARSVHLLPLSALSQPSQVDLLEHDMMLVVLLMKHYRSLRSCNLLERFLFSVCLNMFYFFFLPKRSTAVLSDVNVLKKKKSVTIRSDKGPCARLLFAQCGHMQISMLWSSLVLLR